MKYKDTKILHVHMSPQLYKDLRVIAAEMDTNMSAYVQDLLDKHIIDPWFDKDMRKVDEAIKVLNKNKALKEQLTLAEKVIEAAQIHMFNHEDTCISSLPMFVDAYYEKYPKSDD